MHAQKVGQLYRSSEAGLSAASRIVHPADRILAGQVRQMRVVKETAANTGTEQQQQQQACRCAVYIARPDRVIKTDSVLHDGDDGYPGIARMT